MYQKRLTQNMILKRIALLILFIGLSPLLFSSSARALSGSAIISISNGERTARGLTLLAGNSALNRSAAMKAEDMCAKGYWAHTSPNGTTGWTFMSKAGYAYTKAGENLAKDFSSDSGVVVGWMASASHQANILNGAFQDTGVAVLPCLFQGEQTTIVVAHYGATYSKPAAAPAPTPAPTKTPAPIKTPAPKTNPAPSKQAIAKPTIQPVPIPPQPAAVIIPKPTATESPTQGPTVNQEKSRVSFGAKLWEMVWTKKSKLLFHAFQPTAPRSLSMSGTRISLPTTLIIPRF